MQQVGVLGASFDPPTLGHVNVIEQVSPHFDEILLVPSLKHAFQKNLAPLEHRIAMIKIMMAAGMENIKISNVEQTLQQKYPERAAIYTYDVLSELENEYQKSGDPFQLWFILGPDNYTPAVWQKFYRYQDIEKRWPLFKVKEEMAIHSTQVREIISAYKNAPEALMQKLQKYVPSGVAEYIIQHHLYGT